MKLPLEEQRVRGCSILKSCAIELGFERRGQVALSAIAQSLRAIPVLRSKEGIGFF